MDIEKKIRLWNKRRKLRRDKPQLYIFPEHKFGYIQIPKVASRSIRVAVTAHLSGSAACADFDGDLVTEFEDRFAKHLKQEEIHRLAQKNFIFAFVRNPYERVYSCYKNKIEDVRTKGGKNIFEKHGMSSDLSFEEFVRTIATMPDHKSDRHFRSQAWFLTWQGELLTSFVGKLENIDEDWQVLQKKFGMDPPPRINVSNSKVLPEMSDEIKDLIRARYADDFRLFEYEQ
jgi:dermatan 4-sulfotransferase 1